MKSMLNKLKRKEGQSAIEFIVVVLVVFFFLLFYLSLSMVLVVSQYVDYATFMASRTYKSAYATTGEQQRNAQRVFNNYVQRVTGNGLMRTIPQLSFSTAEPQDLNTAGIQASYDLDLFYMPPVFVKGQTIPSRINLVSESYLGREPNYEECFSFFEQLSQKVGFGIEGSGFLEQMEDNGC